MQTYHANWKFKMDALEKLDRNIHTLMYTREVTESQLESLRCMSQVILSRNDWLYIRNKPAYMLNLIMKENNKHKANLLAEYNTFPANVQLELDETAVITWDIL